MAMRLIPISGLYLLIFFLSINPLQADSLAKLYSKQGQVEVKIVTENSWKLASDNLELNPQDSIRTNKDSRAAILFNDGVLVRLNENTNFTLVKKKNTDPNSQPIEITTGQAYFFSRKPRYLPSIITPLVSGSVRGTEFTVKVTKSEVKFAVLKGELECKNAQGDLRITRGEEARILPNQAPTKHLLVSFSDAVQWALYYPNLSSTKDLEQIDKPLSTLLKEAGEKISLGSVDDVERLHIEIDSRLKADTKLAQAVLYAQKSLLSLTQGNKTLALELAKEANKLEPKSVTGLLAKARSIQAHFDLETSEKVLREALMLEPDNTNAKVALSEILLAKEKHEEAQALLRDILAQDPLNAYALTLNGFSSLSTKEILKGEQYFQQAINSDQNYGLPHLGLGLTLIRQGKLEEGRLEIQKAVHLEPTTSLYRSYLGKAFFEEEKEGLAFEELERAKELDPNDPTPYLYSATLNLSRQKPVSALEEIEDSITRNENRALYRSKLLLDQDQATRANSLGQVFNALDFTRTARLEALKSINGDYANYSSHFLLADTLDSPDQAQAGISENLLASLLAPVNFNAVNPSNGGDVSLNEYSSIFERPLSRTLVSSLFNTRSNSIDSEVTQLGSGLKSAYFLRYLNTYSDGYRDNDFDKQHTVRGFSKYEINPNNTFLLDASTSFVERGDTSFIFDPNENDSDLSQDLDDLSLRVGHHYTFAPKNHLVSQLTYLNSDLDLKDQSLDTFDLNVFLEGELLGTLEDSAIFDTKASQQTKGVRYDLQHIWDSDTISTVAGGSLNSYDLEQMELSTSPADEAEALEDFSFESDNDSDQDSQTAYLYNTWHFAKWLDILGGINYAHLKYSKRLSHPFLSGTKSLSEWSPKVGASFYLSSQATLRLAHYQTVSNSGIRDLNSIEPSQVSGFIQKEDSLPGGRREYYSLGIDYKLPKQSYFGTEIKRVNSVDDFTFVDPSVDYDLFEGPTALGLEDSEFDDHNQSLQLHSYFYQVLNSRLVGIYEHDWIELDQDFLEYQTRTHAFALGFNYYKSNGWFLFSRANYRSQSIDGLDDIVTDDNPNFWIVNAGLGYQFPKRHGFFQIVAQNLLDQDFKYIPNGQDQNFLPGFGLALALTLNF